MTSYLTAGDLRYVKCTSESLRPDLVHEAAQAVAMVARRNRNTEWNRPITCITDDVNTALEHMSPYMRTAYMRTGGAFQELGVTFLPGNTQRGVVIWIRPTQSHESTLVSLAHELSHVVARSNHGHVWRRMASVTTPIVQSIMTEASHYLSDSNIIDVARDIVGTYRTDGWSTVQGHRELMTHKNAARRYCDMFIRDQLNFVR